MNFTAQQIGFISLILRRISVPFIKLDFEIIIKLASNMNGKQKDLSQIKLTV